MDVSIKEALPGGGGARGAGAGPAAPPSSSIRLSAT